MYSWYMPFRTRPTNHLIFVCPFLQLEEQPWRFM